MGTDEGKKLRPRIGSACCFVIHWLQRPVSLTPIELPMLGYLLLLCASYRESRDQREDENGYSHEVQLHVISPLSCATNATSNIRRRSQHSLDRWAAGYRAVVELQKRRWRNRSRKSRGNAAAFFFPPRVLHH